MYDDIHINQIVTAHSEIQENKIIPLEVVPNYVKNPIGIYLFIWLLIA